jgi:hypothetical protein
MITLILRGQGAPPYECELDVHINDGNEAAKFILNDPDTDVVVKALNILASIAPGIEVKIDVLHPPSTQPVSDRKPQ